MAGEQLIDKALTKAARATIRQDKREAEKKFNKYAPEGFKEDIDLLSKKLEQDAKAIAAGKKPFFKSPEEAQQYWDKTYNELAKNMKFQGRNIGPDSDTILYRLPDKSLVARNRTEPAPPNAERISLTHQELRDLMPPRPYVKPPEGPSAPLHSYAATQPPAAVPAPPPAAMPAPGPAAAPAPSPEAVNIARETLRKPAAPWSRPETTPKIPQLPQEPVVPNMRSLEAGAIVPAAGAAGAVYFDPDATKKMAQNILQPPYQPMPGDSSPNLDNIPSYMGPGTSVQPDDFRGSGIPFKQPPGVSFDPSDFAPNGGMTDGPMTPPAPDYSGRELGPYPEMPMGQEQRFRPMPQPGQEQRFRPMPTVSAAREVIQRAQNTPSAQVQQAADTMPKAEQEQGPGAFARLIRGDFREGADQRIMEAMRRQREESGIDGSSMARGGTAKKPSKDDALHKALEIIHHMLTRR